MATFNRAHRVDCSGLLLLAHDVAGLALSPLPDFSPLFRFVEHRIIQILDVGIPTSLTRMSSDAASVHVLMLFVMTPCFACATLDRNGLLSQRS